MTTPDAEAHAAQESRDSDMRQSIDTDLDSIIEKLPPRILESLSGKDLQNDLIEVILDLGREPEARFLTETVVLSPKEVSEKDVSYVVERIGTFGGDNRAGIERTLHRISAIRNRDDKIVGLTLRVGRAVYGTVKIVDDLIHTGKSILLLGRPGVGKTTMLREVARVLADDAHKRVVVVDTSNEIAGDGDIPHPGIGRARRMQVPSPEQQHSVMIEAVENHMPEVIVIDEIGTELEASAARTIAERGVQLVATAHGNTLENLILNPTLSDLVGGIQTVTLGDDEARRRRTQKTVLERRAPPSFDVLVEIQGWSRVALHPDVAEVVDQLLRGFTVTPEFRTMDKDSNVHRARSQRSASLTQQNGSAAGRFESQPDFFVQRASVRQRSPNEPEPESKEAPSMTKVLPYGVNRGKLQQAMRASRVPVELVDDIGTADLLLTTKNYYRRRTRALLEAEKQSKPVYVLRKNTMAQIQQFFKSVSRNTGNGRAQGEVARASSEAKEAVERIEQGSGEAELSPQGSYIRRLQHQIAEEHGLNSASSGQEPRRHVTIYRS